MNIKQMAMTVWNVPNKIRNYVTLKRKKVIYDPDLNIIGKIHVHGFGSIRIGGGVTINSNEDSNPTSGGNSTHLGTGDSGQLIIGNHVGISNCAITAKKRIEIEDYVLIGSNCMISDTDFHSLDAEQRLLDDGSGVKECAITIKRNAWIGARSIILKGVTIGENSIIGAGSVVTKNVPDNEIWGGNPAVFIKRILSDKELMSKIIEDENRKEHG